MSKVPVFNPEQMTDKATIELTGLCRGILADEVVTKKEADYLRKWMVAYGAAASETPMMRDLFQLVESVMSDDQLDQDEAVELAEALTIFLGDDFEIGEAGKTTRLPLDDNPPIEFAGKKFCFTGAFAYGKRTQCQKAVRQRGGLFTSSPSKNTDFLVVGDYASVNWVHTSHGRKIERALEMKRSGYELYILDESVWKSALDEIPVVPSLA